MRAYFAVKADLLLVDAVGDEGRYLLHVFGKVEPFHFAEDGLVVLIVGLEPADKLLDCFDLCGFVLAFGRVGLGVEVDGFEGGSLLVVVDVGFVGDRRHVVLLLLLHLINITQ
jgi:hypothetical protein